MANGPEDMRRLLNVLNESQLAEVSELPNDRSWEAGLGDHRDRASNIVVKGDENTRAWLQQQAEEIGFTFREKKGFLSRSIEFILNGPHRVVQKVAMTIQSMGMGEVQAPTFESMRELMKIVEGEEPTTYTFEVKGKPPFTCEATGRGDAFSQANAHFGSLPQGAWMDTNEPTRFYWALGNFFD